METNKTPLRRVTVELSPSDWKRLEKAVKKKTKETGYTISLSDIIRDLINEHL